MFRLRKGFVLRGLISLSGGSTTLILLLLAYFLFREGLPVLWKSPLGDLQVAVHPDNPIQALSPAQIEAIHKGKIRHWAQLGGRKDSLYWVHPYNLPFRDTMPLRAYLDSCARLKGILMAFPETWMPPTAKLITIKPYTIGEIIGGMRWAPTRHPLPAVGIAPLLVGSLLVGILALIGVVVWGLPMSIYLAEFMSPTWRQRLKSLLEVWAAMPSVVVGFWGLVVVAPKLRTLFHLSVGETAFTTALLLSFFVLPFFVVLVGEAMEHTPRFLKEASYGMGATQWQTILRVILPYVMPQIGAALLLTLGRILGETMIVLMVSGNAATMPTSIFDSVRTLPATLAAELGEAPIGSYYYHMLFFLGVVLFLLTLILNLLGQYIQVRFRR
ncbi:MAG: phosphate ABC transporter permease subunit PstC [Bacteroidia bacterium]